MSLESYGYSMAPNFIDELDFLPTSENRKKFGLFNSLFDKKEIKAYSPEISLYETSDSIFALDRSNSSVVFFVDYSPAKMSGKEAITQIRLWKDETVLNLDSLTRDVFFDVLLKKKGIMLSDEDHTKWGKRFWGKRAAEAFSMGFKVGFYNTKSGDVKYLKDLREFKADVANNYARDIEYRKFRLFIEK